MFYFLTLQQYVLCNSNLSSNQISYKVNIFPQNNASDVIHKNINAGNEFTRNYSNKIKTMVVTILMKIKDDSIDVLLYNEIETKKNSQTEGSESTNNVKKNTKLSLESLFNNLFEHYVHFFFREFFVNNSIWCLEYENYILLIDLGRLYQEIDKKMIFVSFLNSLKILVYSTIIKNINTSENWNLHDVYVKFFDLTPNLEQFFITNEEYNFSNI